MPALFVRLPSMMLFAVLLACPQQNTSKPASDAAAGADVANPDRFTPPADGGCIPEDDSGPADAPTDRVLPDGRLVDGAVVDSLVADAPGVDSAVEDAGPEDGAREDVGHCPEDAGCPCPDDMVAVGHFCVDRYEASRVNATATDVGSDESMAISRGDVLPWYVNPMDQAALTKFEQACRSAGKRLCRHSEWLDSCAGEDNRIYSFGNTFDPQICNSVDTYCQQCCDILGDVDPCPTTNNCGYNSQLSTSPFLPETCSISAPYGRDSCHVCFHVMPTGAFASCTNSHGLYDVNGNVWEVVSAPLAADPRGYQVRGGAFNCGSPASRFRCDFNAGWSALWAGFRCCRDRW